MLMLGALLACWGCGSKDLDEKFGHLELLPSEEGMLEVSLGQYRVPVPTDAAKLNGVEARSRIQLNFTLLAELEPENADSVASAYETAEGRIRDAVISSCRRATLNDLEEPNLLTLKIDMLDAIELLVGPDRIHKLVMPDVQQQEL